MDDFSRATAAPRRMVLGGETVYAQKLTPRAMGIIQAYFKEFLQNPYAAARDAIACMPEDEARSFWVRAVMDAQADWPPEITSEIGINLLSSPHGRGVLVYAVAHRHTRGLTRERAGAIGEAMTADEFFALLEFASPSEVGDLRNPDASGDGMPYAELRAKLCERNPGWTFDTVDDMTFEQIGQACSGGKPFTLTTETDEDARAAAERWREFYVGL